MISAPIPGPLRWANASSTPPPLAALSGSRHHLVANIHSCSRSPAWPNGASRLCGSPVPKPSSEMEKLWTRASDMACSSFRAGVSSVVVTPGAGADARHVGSVDVDRDRGLLARVVDAVDVAGRREAADVADMILAAPDHGAVRVEQLL